MADPSTPPEKNKGGRPPGRLNNRTLALGAQIERLIPTSSVLAMFAKAIRVGLKKSADVEELGLGLRAAEVVAKWKGTEALVKAPPPPPQKHVVTFEYEDPLELPAEPVPKPKAKKKGKAA